jgi:biotin carboxyl carrier protein
MKKYRVTVNGTAYEIELEELTGVSPAAPAATASASAAPVGGEKVTSPMPGTILSLHVATGDTVRKGQVLMVLEAMKMENEIMSPRDGKVVSVSTAKGASVESGTLLCVIQ